MTETSFFYFIEGIAVTFFILLAMQNLWAYSNRLRRILGLILAYWALQHIVSVVFGPTYIHPSHQQHIIISTFEVTAMPTCAMLLFELFRPGWLTWRKVVYNELPFVVLGILSAAIHHIVFFYLLMAIYWGYGLFMMVLSYYGIKRYNRFLKEHYSYDENLNLRWLYVVLFTFVVLMVVYAYASLYLIGLGDSLYIIGSILCWGWICYCIQRQESVLDELQATDEAAAAEPAPDDQADEAIKYLERAIKERFIDKQLYLNPTLKLGDMARDVGTNRTYLSRYLNDTLHTTFYDYINTLRLGHARQLIESSDYNIMTIATLAGFNSYSTFRRTFIAKFGLSPQEYRNQQT